jgi:NTP pyrophosphatase (non-canonical NTP hydrolase)
MTEARMTIAEFQELIERIYGDKDGARGTAGTFMWFSEEVGELSRALRRGKRENLEEEFADVLAWLSTLASMHGVDLGAVAARKYEGGCPRCHATPCACNEPAHAHDDEASGTSGGPAGGPVGGDVAAPRAPAPAARRPASGGGTPTHKPRPLAPDTFA